MLIPALSANSMVPGVRSMRSCSHITNFLSSGFVRTSPADLRPQRSYNANMARRGIPKGEINWFFPEWMAYFGVSKQVDIMEKTGWSKATTSQIMSGKQDYSPKVVNEAAKAFHLAPYELLMRPEEAMALRQLRSDALRVVETSEAMARPAANDRTGTDG